MESWKQSGLAAVLVLVAILAVSGLQNWSLDHGPAVPAATQAALNASPTPATLANPEPVPPTPMPVAFDWSHRFAVYTSQLRDRSTPERAVITWDVTAGKLASSFEYSGNSIALVGHTLVFATATQVVQSALDGTGRREVFAAGDGNVIQDMAVSPDSRSVAIVVTPRNITQPAGVVHVIDLETLQDRLVVQRSDSRLTALRGYFWQVQWRADATGVLIGTGTQTEIWGALITVFLDGRVRIEDVQGYGNVSPTGRMRAGNIGQVQCTFVGARQFIIRDLDAGGVPLSVGGPGSSMVFSPWEWSPDGLQFVFLQQEAATCEELSPEKQVAYVVRTDGSSFPGGPTQVSDLSVLHRDWYGSNLFTADCDHGNEPVVDRLGNLGPLCYLQSGPPPYHEVTVRVGGQAIGTAFDPVPVGVIAP
jgi:hypothetical protein